jgi:hypothetical protein
MTKRATIAALALAGTVVLGACGEDSDSVVGSTG